MLPALNLPKTPLRIQGEKIWDDIRKKWLKLTPEEWVRQHFVYYLNHHLGYPKGRTSTEYILKYGNRNVRADIVIFDRSASPQIIVECKAANVKLTEETFYQAAKYTATLRPKLLILTNGIQHFCAALSETGTLNFQTKIPPY